MPILLLIFSYVLLSSDVFGGDVLARRQAVLKELKNSPQFLYLDRLSLGADNIGFITPNESSTVMFGSKPHGTSDVLVGVGSLQPYSLASTFNSNKLVIADLSLDVMLLHFSFWKILFLACDSPSDLYAILSGFHPKNEIKFPTLNDEASSFEDFQTMIKNLRLYQNEVIKNVPLIKEYISKKVAQHHYLSTQVSKNQILFFMDILKWQLGIYPDSEDPYRSNVAMETRFQDVFVQPSMGSQANWKFMTSGGFQVMKSIFLEGSVYYSVSNIADRGLWKAIGDKVDGKVSDVYLSNIPLVNAYHYRTLKGVERRDILMAITKYNEPDFMVYESVGIQHNKFSSLKYVAKEKLKPNFIERLFVRCHSMFNR